MITDKDARDAMDVVNAMLETGPEADVRTAYLTILTGMTLTISTEDKQERLAELYKIRARQVDSTKALAESLIQAGADAKIVSALLDASGNFGITQSIITVLETNETHS